MFVYHFVAYSFKQVESKKGNKTKKVRGDLISHLLTFFVPATSNLKFILSYHQSQRTSPLVSSLNIIFLSFRSFYKGYKKF